MLDQLRRRARSAGDLVLARTGLRQPQTRLIADAQRYWSADHLPEWPDQSRWRGGQVIDDRRWRRLGAEHLERFDRLAATVGGRDDLGRVLEWGCGGGANAAAFAPRAQQFIAVDVFTESVFECVRQVKTTCTTPVVPVTVEVARPEAALEQLPGPCDLFLCLYVLELVPSPEYGMQIVGLAARSLAAGVHPDQVPGPLVAPAGPRVPTQRRGHDQLPHRGVLGRGPQTRPYPRGRPPRAPHDLDRRYAYFLLRKQE